MPCILDIVEAAEDGIVSSDSVATLTVMLGITLGLCVFSCLVRYMLYDGGFRTIVRRCMGRPHVSDLTRFRLQYVEQLGPREVSYTLPKHPRMGLSPSFVLEQQKEDESQGARGKAKGPRKARSGDGGWVDVEAGTGCCVQRPGRTLGDDPRLFARDTAVLAESQPGEVHVELHADAELGGGGGGGVDEDMEGLADAFAADHRPITAQMDRPLAESSASTSTAVYYEARILSLDPNARVSIGFGTFPFPPFALPGEVAHSVGLMSHGRHVMVATRPADDDDSDDSDAGGAAAGDGAGAGARVGGTRAAPEETKAGAGGASTGGDNGAPGGAEGGTFVTSVASRGKCVFLPSSMADVGGIATAAPSLKQGDVVGVGYRQFMRTILPAARRRSSVGSVGGANRARRGSTGSAAVPVGDGSVPDAPVPTRMRIEFFFTINGVPVQLPKSVASFPAVNSRFDATRADKVLGYLRREADVRRSPDNELVRHSKHVGVLANGGCYPIVGCTHRCHVQVRFKQPFEHLRLALSSAQIGMQNMLHRNSLAALARRRLGAHNQSGPRRKRRAGGPGAGAASGSGGPTGKPPTAPTAAPPRDGSRPSSALRRVPKRHGSLPPLEHLRATDVGDKEAKGKRRASSRRHSLDMGALGALQGVKGMSRASLAADRRASLRSSEDEDSDEDDALPRRGSAGASGTNISALTGDVREVLRMRHVSKVAPNWEAAAAKAKTSRPTTPAAAQHHGPSVHDAKHYADHTRRRRRGSTSDAAASRPGTASRKVVPAPSDGGDVSAAVMDTHARRARRGSLLGNAAALPNQLAAGRPAGGAGGQSRAKDAVAAASRFQRGRRQSHPVGS